MDNQFGYSGNLSEVENVQMIKKMRRDMNFVGIYTVIVGALSCLSIIGAIVGVPTIISGLRLREAAIAFDDFIASGNMGAIAYALERQQKYFNITKILVIVSIAVSALIMLGMIVFFAFFSSKIASMQ